MQGHRCKQSCPLLVLLSEIYDEVTALVANIEVSNCIQ